MGIEEIYEALRAAAAEWAGARGYVAAADPFSFDLQPRIEASAYYVDPPRLHTEGYLGGAQNVTGTFAIWLSREAGDQATVAAARLTGDLGRLAAVLLRADLGADTNVHERFEMDVAPRAEGAVTVVGVLRLSADWDEDGGGSRADGRSSISNPTTSSVSRGERGEDAVSQPRRGI